MRVTQELLNRHSEDAFSHKLMVYSDSGASVIHVRTDEVDHIADGASCGSCAGCELLAAYAC